MDLTSVLFDANCCPLGPLRDCTSLCEHNLVKSRWGHCAGDGVADTSVVEAGKHIWVETDDDDVQANFHVWEPATRPQLCGINRTHYLAASKEGSLGIELTHRTHAHTHTHIHKLHHWFSFFHHHDSQ